MPNRIKRASWIINVLCKKDLVEEIEGNLIELDQLNATKHPTIQILVFWKEVILYLRPSTIKKLKILPNMEFNLNFRLAIRNLSKYKSNTFISLFGFIIGVLSVTYLYFFIENELHYDNFHSKKDEIYRVLRLSELNGEGYKVGVTSGPFAKALESDYPDIIQSSMRVLPQEGLITYGDKKIHEKKLLFTDPNFFQFFSYPLISGDKNNVLNTANSVVISKDVATKYFGEEDPLGKVITVDNEYKFIVSGILGEWPDKSHLDFNMVFNIEFFNSFDWFSEWWNNGLITYVNIKNEDQAQQLNTMLPDFMEKYFGEDFKKNGGKMGLTIQPLKEVYFSDIRFDRVAHGDKTGVIILIIVAASILAIACFNYINLAVAQSYKRAKEVGIRKVLGVSKVRLVIQFLGESLMIVSIAIVTALFLSEILRPYFNQIFGLDVIFKWNDPVVFVFIISLVATILLTAGVYPAVLLSSFRAISVLKGNRLTLGSGLIIRKGLVIAQFSLSIFLIVSTILITNQVNYLSNMSLGYEKENIIIVDIDNNEIVGKLDSFKKRLLQNTNIKSMTSASGEPGGFHDGTVVKMEGVDQPVKVRCVFSDIDYPEVFSIEIISGRGFSEELSTEESTAMLVNRKFVDDLGLSYEEVLNRKVEITYWGIERSIVGIYENYHFASLKDQIEPQMIALESNDRRKIAVKTSGSLNESIETIENVWSEFANGYPISYKLHTDGLANQYKEEEKQANVFTAFSIVSIILACLGIYGLASHTTQRRQKELSIRKVLGASFIQVISLISKEFIILISIACVFAIPIVIVFMRDWLSNFAYHISLQNNWIVFLYSGVVTLIIAATTIILRTYKGALSNPAETIRYE